MNDQTIVVVFVNYIYDKDVDIGSIDCTGDNESTLTCDEDYITITILVRTKLVKSFLPSVLTDCASFITCDFNLNGCS